MKLNLSYNHHEEGEEIVERATPNIETREITNVKTQGFTGQLTKRLGASQTLTYGIDYYHDRFDTGKTRLDLTAGTATMISPATPDGATYTSFGAYVQDEISLGSKLDIILGVRFAQFEANGAIVGQQLNLSDHKTTGNVMALYRLTENLNVVGSIAQGYRAPNMEDLFGRVDFVSEIPNTSLKPETSLNREIGLKYYSQRTSADIFTSSALIKI